MITILWRLTEKSKQDKTKKKQKKRKKHNFLDPVPKRPISANPGLIFFLALFVLTVLSITG